MEGPTLVEDSLSDVLIDNGQFAQGEGEEGKYDRYGDFHHIFI